VIIFRENCNERSPGREEPTRKKLAKSLDARSQFRTQMKSGGPQSIVSLKLFVSLAKFVKPKTLMWNAKQNSLIHQRVGCRPTSKISYAKYAAHFLIEVKDSNSKYNVTCNRPCTALAVTVLRQS